MSRKREDEAGGVSDGHIVLRLRRRGDGVVSLSRDVGESEGEITEDVLERVRRVDDGISDLVGDNGFSSFFILRRLVALGVIVSVAGGPCSDPSGVELLFEELISLVGDTEAVELPGCKNRARAPLKVASLLTGISSISSEMQPFCSSGQSWEASSGTMI